MSLPRHSMWPWVASTIFRRASMSTSDSSSNGNSGLIDSWRAWTDREATAADLATDIQYLIDHHEVPGKLLEARVKVTTDLLDQLAHRRGWVPEGDELRLVITGLNLVQASDIGNYVELEVELE